VHYTEDSNQKKSKHVGLAQQNGFLAPGCCIGALCTQKILMKKSQNMLVWLSKMVFCFGSTFLCTKAEAAKWHSIYC
jgi:hypothetical protein